MTDERRKSKRYQTPEFKSNLSDGNSAFIVVIEDVSLTGVGVSQVPEGFDETVTKCFAVINAPQKDFTLVLQPRWVSSRGKGPYKRIGFQIENPPPAWLDFVETLKEEIPNIRRLVPCHDAPPAPGRRPEGASGTLRQRPLRGVTLWPSTTPRMRSPSP